MAVVEEVEESTSTRQQHYHDSMTINVNGGIRGAGDGSASYAGFAGSVGKVFLVSRFSLFL